MQMQAEILILCSQCGRRVAEDEMVLFGDDPVHEGVCARIYEESHPVASDDDDDDEIECDCSHNCRDCDCPHQY